MKREVAHQISRTVDDFLEIKRDNTTEECKAVIANAVERTLIKLQKHLTSDLDFIAKDAGGELAEEMQRSLFELANNTWYDHARQDMLIVPEGTKFIHRQGTRIHVAIEQKPEVRTIKYLYRDTRNPVKYRIATPFCLFVFPITSYPDDHGENRYKIEGGRLAFLRKPLTSLDDMLYYPCLPNIDTRTRKTEGAWMKVCMGGGYHTDFTQNMSKQMEAFISYFWQAPFGIDWEHEYINMISRDSRFEIKNWAKETERNPLFVLENGCRYREAGTFRQLVTISVGQDNNLNVPLKKIVKKAVEKLTIQIVKRISKTDIAADFDPRFVNKAMYETLCAVVRQCFAEIEGEMVVAIKKDQAKMDNSLTDLLIELEKRVTTGPQPGEKKGYWWS